jgi:hypothetical protein
MGHAAAAHRPSDMKEVTEATVAGEKTNKAKKLIPKDVEMQYTQGAHLTASRATRRVTWCHASRLYIDMQ